MATNIVRNYSVYLNGKKVGSAEGSDIALDSGDELQVGDGEVYGVSEGVVTGTLTLNAIVPISPTSTPVLLDAILNKKWIQLGGGIIEGKVMKVDARVKSIAYSSQSANGSLKGKYDLIFGKPTTV